MKEYSFYGWKTADIKDSRGLTPADYYDILSGAWCAETCAPRMRSEWSPENKTKGQCSITAFLMQDVFGGKVLGIPLGDGNYHCFNAVGDCVFDLTSEQFSAGKLNYDECVEQLREVHFSKDEKRKRYELLKERVNERLRSANEIEILRAEHEWQRAGAYSVRIEGMNRQYHISLREEFDEHDGDGTKYIVILDGGYPVGTCRFYPRTAESVVIGRVVVLPEYRGRGLGRVAVEEAEKWASELGYTFAEVDSRIPAVGFYEKLGYVKTGKEAEKNGVFDCIAMRRRIAE